MTLRLAFLGDTLLGGVAQATLDRRGYAYAFAGLKPLLSEADLVIVNHEGPLTLAQQPVQKTDTGRKRYWYRGCPISAEAMRDAGVGVASLANNHVLDFGIRGLMDTITALDSAGIAHCGAGQDEAEARLPAVVNIGGCRVGFLSYMQRYAIYLLEDQYALKDRAGCARLQLEKVPADLAALCRVADIRIVLVHWGRNYRAVSPRQDRLAVALREAGADMVIGHHPHIPQRVDLSGDSPVFFSLGNGPLGTPGRFHGKRPPFGLVALVDVNDSNRISGVEIWPIAVDNSRVEFSPVPVGGSVGANVIRSLVTTGGDWESVEVRGTGVRWQSTTAHGPGLPPRLAGASPSGPAPA